MLNIPYYLYQSIDMMSFIAQNKYYDHQMQSIFHHSLIEMIALHYLDQLNIAWDAFISNNIFTVPPIYHGQEASSSSHPSTSIPPPQPAVHTSSPNQSLSPTSPPSSPFRTKTGSPRRGEISKTKRVDLGIMAHTYQRGHRQVFAPQILGGSLPYSSTKKLHKGKEK